MAQLGKYDTSLHMFVELPSDPDMRWLDFLRWLGEHGKLEHWPAGPSSGPLATVEDEAAETVAV